MPRRKKRGFRLPIISLGPVSLMIGDSEGLRKGKDEDYVTTLFLVLPLEEEEFIQEKFELNHDDWKSPIRIRFKKVEDESQDLISIWGSAYKFGANPQLQDLSFSIFTDNRGKYPCFYAEIEFPYRLEDWKNKPKDQVEQSEFTGINSKDKSLALQMINKLFKASVYPREVPPLAYEDVTCFFEQYFLKGSPEKPIFQRLTAMDSREAFEEAIIEYLGDDLLKHVANFNEIHQSGDISTEADLFEVVKDAIVKVIKHPIENRNCIQPYWDDEREHEGKKIPKKPKKETSIQPIIYVLLHTVLFPLGIHIEREVHEGVGLLDFKCLYTAKRRKPFSIMIELKLAHNKKLEHGLRMQLPSYLKANKSQYGVYLVMWFKDEQGQVFNKPKDQTKGEMEAKLQEIAESVQVEHGYTIKTELIDASVRTSASKL